MTHRRRATHAVALLSAALTASCATVDTGAMPIAPLVPTISASGLEPLAPYRLQVGDVLDVRLPLSPELDDEVIVRPDGHISTTVVGDAVAADLTVPELERALNAAYTNILRNPRLSVIVKSASVMRVYVAGQVNNPGEFRSDGPGLTLAQAVTLAGGPRVTGDAHHVFILRRGPGGRAMFLRTRYGSIAGGVDAANDVRLAPYDVVFVPRTGIALAYQYFNQYVQQFVPVSWGFNYELNAPRGTSTVTQPAPIVSTQ